VIDRAGSATASVIAAAVAFTVCAPASAQEHEGEPRRFAVESQHMGTTFRIVAWTADEPGFRRATQAALDRVAHLDSLFSDYRDDSEVAGLARAAGEGVWTPVSDELWAVLTEGRRWSERSEGAFDVTVGPLSRLWRWSARRGELPDSSRLTSARAAVDFRLLDLKPGVRAAALTRAGMSLDLGGIAKGFAADAALTVLADQGFHAALVDAGGDLAIGAAPPGEDGWVVALPGGDRVTLENTAVATSGDAHRHVVIQGARYSHIVDPRTGLGVVDAPVVTVLGPNAATADALASALSVLDAPAGRALAESVEGTWVRVRGPVVWSTGSAPPEVQAPTH
jgi:thiamine biosynthesis lipoprotein